MTTYGADAITGVVNFITRRDFAGVEVSASEQITEKGDGNYLRADLTLGANFDDGRGNAVLSVGYQESDPVYQGDRDFSFFQVSAPTPAARRVRAQRSRRASPVFVRSTRPPARWSLQTPATGNRGVSQVEWREGQVCQGGSIAGNYAPFNFNPYNIFQTPFTRYNIFGQAHYEVSDAVEVYGRGLFSKNNVKTIVAPSGSFGGSVPINLNNPFLPATLRNQFCAFDVNPSALVYQARFTQAECDAAAAATGPGDPNYRVIGQGGTFVPFDIDNDGVIATDPITGEVTERFNTNPGITLNRRTTEVGPRISDYQTTTFDSRIGLRGPLTSTVDWDISGSYGNSENIQDIQGYTLQSRFACGLVGQPGPDHRPSRLRQRRLRAASRSTSSDRKARSRRKWSASSTLEARPVSRRNSVRCAPLSRATSVTRCPGRPSRSASPSVRSSASIRAGRRPTFWPKSAGELGGAGGATPDIKGGYAVYEGYGELIAPIVEDKEFFESLTLEAGVRYSKYEIDGRPAPTRPGPGRPAAAGSRVMASRSAATTARRFALRTSASCSRR